MHPEFQRLMADAAQLVRGGDLHGATAAIQAALHGNAAGAPRAPYVPPAPGPIVIDVEAREVDAPWLNRAPLEGPRVGAPPSQAAGTFMAGRCGDGRTQREYKLYVPPQAGERPLPLIVMLHGCTQNPDDFAVGTRMNDASRRQGCFVLYPAQSQQANPQRCWNWFKHSHQQRGRGEPALLAAMTRHVMARHDIDAHRVYVAGLSAGGAMATILGEAYPDLYAAVGVHRSPEGEVLAEHWLVHGSGHAWSGGSPQGSFTDPHGPDATEQMLRFFLQHPRR